MSFTFKDYKINRIALLFIKVLTLSQKQVKIQNSVPSISQTFYSIDRKNEEIHHLASAFFNWFLNPIRSIEKYIRSVEKNSQSIKTRITEFFRSFQEPFLTSSLLSSIKNTFWFYQWRFTDQTLKFWKSLSRTLIMLETLKA